MRAFLRGLLGGMTFLVGTSYFRLFYDACKVGLAHFWDVLFHGYEIAAVPTSYITSFVVAVGVLAVLGNILSEGGNSDE